MENKYSEYHHKWIKADIELATYLPEAINVDVFLFPDEQREFRGFCIDLYLSGILVGNFHCFLDLDEGFMNDAEIDEAYQRRGLGKILLMAAIDTGMSYLGAFAPCSRGVNPDQWKIYDWIDEHGIWTNEGLDYKKASMAIDEITQGLEMQWMKKN